MDLGTHESKQSALTLRDLIRYQLPIGPRSPDIADLYFSENVGHEFLRGFSYTFIS